MIEREGCREERQHSRVVYMRQWIWSHKVSQAISEATQGKETDSGKWAPVTPDPISDGVNHAHIMTISEKRTIFHLD